MSIDTPTGNNREKNSEETLSEKVQKYIKEKIAYIKDGVRDDNFVICCILAVIINIGGPSLLIYLINKETSFLTKLVGEVQNWIK